MSQNTKINFLCTNCRKIILFIYNGGKGRGDSRNLVRRLEISKTRGHGIKVRGEDIKGDARGTFISWRVMGAWNILAGIVVETDMIMEFKRIGTWICWDKDHVQVAGSNLSWFNVQHRHCERKVLLLCCIVLFNTLCSINRYLISVQVKNHL